MVMIKQISLSRRGFTLLEVLTVISVMVILASIVLPSLRTSRNRAFEAKTEAQLSSLALALKLYKADMGQYPDRLTAWVLVYGTQGQGQASLGPRWKGPYIELKQGSDMSSGGDILDAWGQPFRYRRHDVLTDGRFFDLYSIGRDGQDGTDDDIKHWEG